MLTITSPQGTVKMSALVRDKEGKPKFDDPENIPPELWELLTTSEKEAIKNGSNTRNSNTQ